MEVDGKIRVRPKFDNSDAQKGAKELEDMLNRIKKKTEEAFSANPDKGLEKIAKSAERDLNKIDRSLDKAKAKLKEYEDQLKNIDVKIDAEFAQTNGSKEVMSTRAIKGDGAADALVEKKMSENKVVQKLNSEYDKVSAKIEKVKEQISSLNQQHDETLSKFTQQKQEIENVSSVIDHTGGAMQKVKDGAENVASSVKKAARNQKDFTSSISKGLKSLAKMSLAIFGIQSAYSLVRQAVSSVISSNETLSKKIEGCKNMLGAVFEPLVTSIVNGIVTAMSYLSAFIQMLTGINLIAKANAKALDKQAGSAGKVSKSLLALDEIHNLNSNSGSGAGSSAGLLEETDGLKGKFEELLEPIKNAWEKYGQGFIDGFKVGLVEIQGLIGAIGSSFSEVWLNGTGETTCSLILIILTDIFNTIGNISGGLKDAWIEGGKGTAIIQSLWNIFNNILTAVQKVSGSLSKWSKSVNFNPLLTGLQKLIEAFERITGDIAPAIEWFMETILEPLGTFVIEDAVPAFFNLLAGALDLLNSACDVFMPLGQWLLEYFLIPIGLWTGGIVIEIINGIADAFRKISDWISENQFLVETLVILFGSFFAALELVYGALNLVHTAAKLWNAASSIGAKVTTAFGTAMTFLKGPIGLVVLAIAAVIAIVVLLIRHWDEVKEAAGKCWDWIVGKWNDASAWFDSTIVQPIKSLFVGMINGLISAFEKFVNSGIKGINWIIEGLNSLNFSVPDWIPDWLGGGKTFGVNIKTLDEKSFPRIPLAQGGIVNRPTRTLIGEAGAEAVLPLQNSSFIASFADQISSRLDRGHDSSGMSEVIQLMLDILDILKQILDKDSDLILDGESLTDLIEKKLRDREKRQGSKALQLTR